MSGLEFTDEAARQLEKVYLTRDVIAQRMETIRHLNLSQGERVLDIGVWPGLSVRKYGRDRWSQGDRRRHRYLGRSNRPVQWAKNFHLPFLWVGDATKLNQPNASFDVVVCTQVAEYVADIDRVFSEAFRVLKPNGRTVFVATDWSTILWHSENPRRMATVMKSWEAHSAHPRLPMSMAQRFINAGFQFDGAAVFPILNLQYDDDSYSKKLTQIIRDFVARKNDVSADDLKEWHDEFERLSEARRYFFTSNRYIFKALKPAL